MKKILVLMIFIFIPVSVIAQECPFGEVNDPAPGNCARFIDQDKNNLCDLSEIPVNKEETEHVSEDDLKKKTVEEVAGIYNINVDEYIGEISAYLGRSIKSTDNLGYLHDEYGLCSGVAAGIANALGQNKKVSSRDKISGTELKAMKIYEIAELHEIDENDFANALSDYLNQKVKLTDLFQTLHDNYDLEASVVKDIAYQMQSEEAAAITVVKKEKTGARYKLLPIVLVLVILYAITLTLTKKEKITLLTHRRIWNVLLLLSFLASVILGVLLIIRINWGWSLNLPFNMLYWHVETGAVMAVITMFHLSWYWRFYISIFKKRK